MLDIELLKIMKYKRHYRKLIGIVHSASMDTKTNLMLEAYGKYFDKFPDEERVNMKLLGPRLVKWYPDIARSDEQLAVYVGIMRQAQHDASDTVTEGISNELHEARLATTIGALGQKWDAGEIDNLVAEVQEAVSTFRTSTAMKQDGWIDTPIGELLQEEADSSGVKWRLDSTNNRIRGLRAGDFVIVAARPDDGKTSFVSDTVSYVAPQLAHDRPILWLNNEGPGKRIVPRIWQAALGVTTSRLVELNNQGVLNSMYEEKVGALDKIRVKDIHGMDVGKVESLIEYHRPGLVVMDMIDNVKGFGDAPRTDLMLERMYQWAREMCVTYELITIATSQLSADAVGLQYPDKSMLKDSKTGKQGAADLIITLGSVNDPASRWLRYIGMPKNKLRLPGAPSSAGDCVFFNSDISRFEPLPEEL